MGLRKDAATLSVGEKTRFVRACRELKRRGGWDDLVEIHRATMFDRPVDPAHMGPAFLPWHREYLRRFELALQSVDRSVTVPYWRWDRDHSPQGAPWTSDLLGGDGDPFYEREVLTGAFAYRTNRWPLTVNDAAGTRPFLRRALGASTATLPAAAEVDAVLATVPYDAAPYDHSTDPARSFRAGLERLLHNDVHMWIGETMLAGAAPNDPVFFLVHCYVDYLWARWQTAHPEQRYLPDGGAQPGHNLNDGMWPWDGLVGGVTPAKVWDHTRLGYSYGFEPR